MQQSESADSHNVEAMFANGSPTSSATSYPAVSRIVGPPMLSGIAAAPSSEYLKCDVCQEARAILFCPRDRSCFCQQCDFAAHAGAQATACHERYALAQTKITRAPLERPVSAPVAVSLPQRVAPGCAPADEEAFLVDDLLDLSETKGESRVDSAFSRGQEQQGQVEQPRPPVREPPSASGATSWDSEEVGEVGDLCDLPCDDLAELDWLSTFVENSYSSPDGVPLSAPDDGGRFQGAEHPPKGVGMRSKRQRAHPNRTWSAELLIPRTDDDLPKRPKFNRSWSTSNLSRPPKPFPRSSIPEAASCSDLSALERACSQPNLGYECEPAPPEPPAGIAGANFEQLPHPLRRCLHCASTKTPQWRAGPMGVKTLCNACGVRYKSGRLVADYRPAGSPGFAEGNGNKPNYGGKGAPPCPPIMKKKIVIPKAARRMIPKPRREFGGEDSQNMSSDEMEM